MKRMPLLMLVVALWALLQVPADACRKPLITPSPGALVAMGNFCLDAWGGKLKSGVPIKLYRCHGKANQRIHFAGKGRLAMGNFCLDAWGGKLKRGVPIKLYRCHGKANQRFFWAGGQIKIGGLCLGAWGGHINNGVPIRLHRCRGKAHQRFWIRW